MDFLLQPLTDLQFEGWETFLSEWVFVIALGVLALEMIRYAISGKLSWGLAGDSITNYITLTFYIVLSAALLATLYIGVYYSVAQFSFFEISTNWASVAVCIVLADLTYYWEHRFSHRVNVAWATHTVHHSSPNFNISVAYRFGPLDGLWPIPFHIPLLLLGFDPVVVLFAEIVVQEYQTFLHTEAVGKLPRPIEAVMNTPSHHRVHHGSNPEYLDKNYGGIFIIWDRLFGTYAEEVAKVTYGLVTPINSINPLVVWFHGFYRLGKDVLSAGGIRNTFLALFGAPAWRNNYKSEAPKASRH
ncbi:MAG: sterol desaturase family protein [Alphaproteobacteria bacterium]|nr:sterol desaturase family protein [Alphaproteobacteria bacterium]